MKRIQLTKDEKQVLRNIAAGVDYWPDGMGEETLSACVASLEAVSLVRGAWSSGHIVVTAELTDLGTAYLLAFPSLRNPVDWVKVGALAAVTTAILVAIGILCACQIIINS